MIPERKRIALTFDDGPSPGTTDAVLDLLAQYGAAASFFLVGSQIGAETAPIIRRAQEMGCEICHHSFSHSDMSRMTPAEIAAEMEETTRRITVVTGSPPKFFRPPYIAVSDTMFAEIPLPFVAGYGVDDYDDAVSAEQRYQGVMKQAKNNAIILLHDKEGNVQTVEALARLLPALRDAGYDFVTMSGLFAETGITPLPNVLYSYAEQIEMYAAE